MTGRLSHPETKLGRNRRLDTAGSEIWPAFRYGVVGLAIWLTASCHVWAQQPVPAGWRKQTFDFGSTDLRGEILVPANADFQTVEIQPRQAGTAGNVTVVGKIAPSATVPADVTIMALDLEYPAAALRVCLYEAGLIGLEVFSRSVAEDLSSASVRSMRVKDGRFEQVAYSRCLTRGTKLLVFHFIASPAATDEESAFATGGNIETFARTALDGLTFADGKPVSHWAGMTDVPLKLGSRTVALPVSPAWSIAINDFQGGIPAELSMVRKRDGKDAGLVWLGAFDSPAGFDIARDGETFLRDFIARQSPDFGSAKLLSSDSASPPDGVEGTKNHFHFDIATKTGGEAGEVFATVALSGDRLYTAAWWSPPVSGDGRAAFMARLPGMTAFDLARRAADRMMAAP